VCVRTTPTQPAVLNTRLQSFSSGDKKQNTLLSEDTVFFFPFSDRAVRCMTWSQRTTREACVLIAVLLIGYLRVCVRERGDTSTVKWHLTAVLAC
jgi:hypothetical protein